MKTVILKKYLALTFALIFCLGAFSFNIGFFKHKANEKAARFENRKLTQFPKGKRILMKKDFYKEFENWYRDRMWGRRKLLKNWNRLNFYIGAVKDKNLIYTLDEWLLSKWTPKNY
ncbi:MAG: hypothetical protein KBS60_01585, partial [Phascolarctobacterium sp.]|nr:hypothetical protein [Candidatus Phascolarctobacterium caballi]